MKVSWFYERNSMLFPDFQHDLKAHLVKYVSGKMRSRIESADTLHAQITSFNRADYQSGERRYGVAAPIRNSDGSVGDGPSLDFFREMQRRFKRKTLNITVEEVSGGDDD